MKYSETLTEDVKELQMCCTLYLQLKLQDASSMIKFNFDNKDWKDVVLLKPSMVQYVISGAKDIWPHREDTPAELHGKKP